jgi:hypothetical protein
VPPSSPLPPSRSTVRARRGASRPAGSTGQATLEYVAVVAVVAAVLATVGTVVAGPAIANGVGGAFQRALCVVTGTGCRTLTPPVCTVRTAGTDISAKVKVTFVRLGRTAGLLRTERSDGTVDVTLLDKVDGGLVATAGASGRLELGGHDLGIGGLAEASVVAQLGGGRVWRVPDRAAADALQRKLVQVLVGRTGSSLPLVGPALSLAQRVAGVGSGVDLPRPSQRIVSAKLGGGLKVEGPLGLALHAAANVTVGGGHDLVAGGGTIYLTVDAAGGAALLSGLAGLDLTGEARLAVTVDRHGRPLTIAVTGTGRVTGRSAGRPGGAERPEVSTARADERSAVVTATLDATAAGGGAALVRLLHALAHLPAGAGETTAAARAFGATLAAGARVDVATYGRQEQRYGGGAEAGLGVGAGLDLEVVRARSVLLDAWTRPPGGLWEPRLDCLARV